MQSIALVSVTWAVSTTSASFADKAQTKAKETWSVIRERLHWGAAAQPSSFDIFQGRVLSMLEYVPDLSSILDGGLVFAKEYAYAVPYVVRMAIAAFTALNLTIVPPMIIQTLKSVWDLLAHSAAKGLTGVFEGAICVVHLSSLTSVFSAMGASGLVEYFNRFQLPTQHLQALMGAVFPWVGYALRISVIPQLMDIFSGMPANARLGHELKALPWKDRVLFVLPIRQMRGELGSVPIRLLMSPLYHSAVVSLGIISSNVRLYSKVADANTDLQETVKKISSQVDSWFPPVSWYGCLKARSLAGRLQVRSQTQVHNQLLGLTANLAAFAGIVAVANAVAVAVFAILQSMFYIMQTYHRQTQMA